MILFITGTHEQPFDRLVRAAEQLALRLDEEVIVQRGPSREPAPHCEVEDLLPHHRLLELMSQARVIVTHGGPATILEAATWGVPIVVPRDPAHGEHVDGHQQAFSKRLRDRVHVVEDPLCLESALAEHARVAADLRPMGLDRGGLQRSVHAFEQAVDGLGRPRRGRIRRGIRATITLLARRRLRRP